MSKRKILVGIFATIIVAVVFFIIVVRQHYVLPVLMYHSVSPKATAENRLNVSVATFERQMLFLKEHRYNVLPLGSLVDLIKNKKKIPPSSVVITFDDGYRNNFDYAFPILKKYKFPATIFIIVREVGRSQADRLNWKEIKIMSVSRLISFGSHGIGPDPLTKIESEEDLRKEICDSKKILEEKLGRKITLFSYPEGRFNDKIRGLVIACGYELAVATNPGRNYPDNDIFALRRLRISESSKNPFIFWFKVSGFHTFLKEKRN